MAFLDETAAKEAIRERLAQPGRARLAVAFWGAGAGKELGLVDRPDGAEIICNLVMGGTNPAEIKHLREKGLNVRQSDALHAKVYLFDDCAIVGSSNASSNGLSFQERDGLGWLEANILVREEAVLKQLSAWFDDLKSDAISNNDLELALAAWKARRDVARSRRTPSLLKMLRTNPGYFDDREGYLAVYKEGLSEEATAALLKARQGLDESVEAYENWDGDLPASGQIANFLVSARALKFDGYNERTERLKDHAFKGGILNLCLPRTDIFGFQVLKGDKEEMEAWGRIAGRIQQSTAWKDNDGAVVALSEMKPFVDEPPPVAESKLAKALDVAMRDLDRRIRAETSYRPNTFRSMLANRGGLATAKALMAGKAVSHGFGELVMLGRPDLTMEALILHPKWSELFHGSELAEAERRLRGTGFQA